MNTKDKYDILLEQELSLVDTDEVTSCDDKRAKVLLKKWYNNSYKENSIVTYLPAIKNGLMRKGEKYYSHNQIIEKGKRICESINQKELAHAFIYGIAHNDPEYRYPLIAYYHFMNTPSHDLAEDTRYRSDKIKKCAKCGYSEYNKSIKSSFDSVNLSLAKFYFGYPEVYSMDLNSSIIYLEEYLKLPKVKSTVDDFNLFIDSISFIASLDNAYPFEISEKLYKSKILPMTKEQVRTYLNLLGHLNILHHPKTVGIAKAFTSASDIDILDHMYTKSAGNEFTYPFRLYNTAFGVDFYSIDYVFYSLQEDY